MSIDFSAFPNVALWLGAGQKPLTQPIKLCTPIDSSGPRIVSVTVPWASAPYSASIARPNVGVSIDLRNQQQVSLDAIRSVKIDNTYNDVPVFLQFNDSFDTIVCPPNSIIYAPVFTHDQKAILFGSGFFTGRTPKTTVYFANIDRQGLVLLGDIGYHVNAKLTDMAIDNVDASQFTFTPKLGSAYAGRLCAFYVAGKRVAAGGLNFQNAPTIGGNALTLVPSSSGTVTVASDSRARRAAIYYGIVPANGGNLVVDFNNSADYCAFASWVIRDYSVATPFAGNTDTDTELQVVTDAMDIVPGGCAVWGNQMYYAAVIPDATQLFTQWTGDGIVKSARVERNFAVPLDIITAGDYSDAPLDTSIVNASSFGNLMTGAVWI